MIYQALWGVGVFLFSVQFLDTSYPMTIDQIVSKAANSSLEFDFFYDEQNAVVKVEYDMEYTMEDWKILQQLNKPSGDFRKKRKALRGLHVKWTNNTIPYELAEHTFGSGDNVAIMEAIDEWDTYTCLKFRYARYSDRHKITFQNGGGVKTESA